jgi:hypothetical protein
MSKDMHFEMAEIENRKFYYQIIITNQNQNDYENIDNNHQNNAIVSESIITNQGHQEGCTESIPEKQIHQS